MKIKKINENQIKITLKKEDFKNKNLDMKQVLFSTPDLQKLILEVLKKAEKQVNFNTEGHKLLINAGINKNDVFTFTITKYLGENLKGKTRTIKVKKPQILQYIDYFFEFEDIENFIELCQTFKNININVKGLYKKSSLYFYNNKYYLVLERVNRKSAKFSAFLSYVLEFANAKYYSKNFKTKLKEHGRTIFKTHAIQSAINYFC